MTKQELLKLQKTLPTNRDNLIYNMTENMLYKSLDFFNDKRVKGVLQIHIIGRTLEQQKIEVAEGDSFTLDSKHLSGEAFDFHFIKEGFNVSVTRWLEIGSIAKEYGLHQLVSIGDYNHLEDDGTKYGVTLEEERNKKNRFWKFIKDTPKEKLIYNDYFDEKPINAGESKALDQILLNSLDIGVGIKRNPEEEDKDSKDYFFNTMTKYYNQKVEHDYTSDGGNASWSDKKNRILIKHKQFDTQNIEDKFGTLIHEVMHRLDNEMSDYLKDIWLQLHYGDKELIDKINKRFNKNYEYGAIFVTDYAGKYHKQLGKEERALAEDLAECIEWYTEHSLLGTDYRLGNLCDAKVAFSRYVFRKYQTVLFNDDFEDYDEGKTENEKLDKIFGQYL